MLDTVVRFVGALREAGVPVSLSESIDATRALEAIPLEERRTFKAALSTTLVKNEGQAPVFDTLFELYFPSTHGDTATGTEASEPEELRQELADALASGDAGALPGIARAAVGAFGRVETSPGGDWYSQYQTTRALDLRGLLAELLREIDEDGTQTELDRRVRSDALRSRVRDFTQALLNDTRRRVAENRGPEAVARYAVNPPLEEMTFFSMSEDDIAALRKAIRPLARKLATRVAMKRKRATRGQLDIRRTVRHALSSGGVAFDPAFRHRTPHRPELFVLCDVSSSVARFARFALMLTHALSTQFSRVRSFAFVDEIDEVTRFFEHEDFVGAIDRMTLEANVVRHEGRSDYGAILRRFNESFGRDVGPRTTLFILGDARNNYRLKETNALRSLTDRAHRTYWLNPEPSFDWDTGDSIASDYSVLVEEMVEVRNLRQLEDFIAKVL
jgi:uncharacterized protein with von Willebrand factor type A (vWA) domain